VREDERAGKTREQKKREQEKNKEVRGRVFKHLK
jgi:hypothetical protein